MKQQLTHLQTLFLQKICFLLFAQLFVLLVVVYVVHQWFPKQLCLFTCRFWVDFLLYLLLVVGLIMVSNNTGYNLVVRYTAFFGFSVLLAYIMGLQYNRIAIATRNDKKTATTFFKAVAIVLSVFVINLIMLPFTLKYMGFLYTLSISLSIALVGLILWGLFVGRGLLIWVSISLFVFLGLLLTDLNRLVHQCRTPNSFQCDPLNGASLLYADLINILQDIFILLNAGQK